MPSPTTEHSERQAGGLDPRGLTSRPSDNSSSGMQVSALFTCDAGPSLVKFHFLLALVTLHALSMLTAHMAVSTSVLPPLSSCICQKQRIPGHLVFTSSTANTGLCGIEMKITQIYSP